MVDSGKIQLTTADLKESLWTPREAYLLLELLLLALAELPLETGVLLGGLGHATHLVNAAQQEAALPAITIRNENSRRLSLITSARPNELLRPLLHPLVCKFTQPSLQSFITMYRVFESFEDDAAGE